MSDDSESMAATPVGNRECNVVAIIAAYNEGDIIEQVVRHLIAQEVDVYLLDHCSTDDTVARLRPYLGRGVLHIERFPDDISGPPEDASRFVWEKILRRKAALAQTLDADWFMHHDADEFRESPFAHLNLREAIRTVDRFGYNAIDFELLDFWPTHNNFDPAVDVRDAFGHYRPGDELNRPQIRCWKKTANPVDLLSRGGHDAVFPDRRVFPIRFILRHYPIRREAHGRRKVFQERKGRFLEEERRQGWHIQYDGIGEGHSFLHEPGSLLPYDPETVRLQLLINHRGVEEVTERLDASVAEVERLRGRLDVTIARLERLNRQFETVKLERDTSNQAVARLTAERDRSNQELEHLRGQVTYMLGSWSWRLTTPVRGIRGLVRRVRRNGRLTSKQAPN